MCATLHYGRTAKPLTQCSRDLLILAATVNAFCSDYTTKRKFRANTYLGEHVGTMRQSQAKTCLTYDILTTLIYYVVNVSIMLSSSAGAMTFSKFQCQHAYHTAVPTLITEKAIEEDSIEEE